MKKWFWFLLKLALTAGCLWWAFSGVDIRSTVFAHPERIDFRWLAAGVALAGAGVFLTAVRWGVCLSAQGVRVPVVRLVELTLIGNLFSTMSVGGWAGDAARVLLLIRREPQRKLAVTVSVLADHACGMVALVLLFVLFTAGRFEALEAQSSLGKGVLRFAYVYLGGGLAVILLGFLATSPLVHGRVHRGGRWIRWEFMKTVPETWDVYRREWRRGLLGTAVGCVMLVPYFLAFWCGMQAVGCGIPAGSALTALPVVDAIASIPVTVSGIGVREKLFVVLLGDLAGIDPSLAVSASLAGFLCHAVWSLVGGVLFLMHRGEVTAREIGDYHG